MVEPDISEKNIENTGTTCDRPPRIWPTSVIEKLAIRPTTLDELINSPTSRKKGMASRASESMPSNIFWTIEAIETSVIIVPTSTPAINEKATGTPI